MQHSSSSQASQARRHQLHFTRRTMASAAVAPATTASVGAPSTSAAASAQHPGATAAIAPATAGGGGAICNSSLDEQIERLRRCEYLREGEVKALCLRAREILVDESNVQRVDAPVTVSSVCREREKEREHIHVLHLFCIAFCFIFLSRPNSTPHAMHAKTHIYARHMRYSLSHPSVRHR